MKFSTKGRAFTTPYPKPQNRTVSIAFFGSAALESKRGKRAIAMLQEKMSKDETSKNY